MLRHLARSLPMTATLALVTPPLAADPGPADEAVRLGYEALTAYEGDDCPTALKLLAKASKLAESPVFTLYTARCRAKLGRLLEAEAAYVFVVALSLDDNAPAAWLAAQRQANSELSALRSRIARVRFTGREVAWIEMDGRRIEPGSLVRVDPGRHALSAVSTDGSRKTTTLVLDEGQTRVHEVRFSSRRKPIASITAPRSEPTDRTGAERGPEAPPAAPTTGASHARWAGYGLLGLSAVGLAAGSYFGLRANSLADEFKPSCDGNQCLASDGDKGARARRFATLSTVSFAVAAAAAVGGVVVIVRVGASDSEPAARVGASRYSARASVAGAF